MWYGYMFLLQKKLNIIFAELARSRVIEEWRTLESQATGFYSRGTDGVWTRGLAP